jgi:UDP-N-acetylglucosamine transferase subunit ALG13
LIFVTVGSQLGFDRMVGAVAAWARTRGTGMHAADMHGTGMHGTGMHGTGMHGTGMHAAEGTAAEGTGIFFQTGATKIDLAGFAHMPVLSAEEIRRKFDEATLVVAHAGTGTIIECMLRGKPVIVMPRSASLHETRNDHQFATARRFQARGGVFVAWDETELAALLDRASTLTGGAAIQAHADQRLLDALRAFVAG